MRSPLLRTSALLLSAAIGAAAAGAGCGHSAPPAAFKLPPDERPVPIGRGTGYQLGAISAAVRRRAVIAGLGCARTHGPGYAIHLELYVRRFVLPVPAGIGIAPPQRRQGAYVLGGSCSYPLRTLEPTGVVRVDAGPRLTVGALFAVWGQVISSHSLAGFTDGVLAFVGGRRWPGSPAQIPLRRHAEIVLEVGGRVLPHPAYHFPPGL